MADIKCAVCGKGPIEGVTLYRTGNKGPGENPFWKCPEHIEQYKVDPAVKELTETIEKGNTNGLA